jgi:hypothetical protein
VSVISKALRRIRVIKELNRFCFRRIFFFLRVNSIIYVYSFYRSVDELKKTENNWKATPVAERYKKLLKKFQIKVKVSENKHSFSE